jgi:hypothetical protein
MKETKTYTEAQAERFFAIEFHGQTWQLLDKPDRTDPENEFY